MVDVDELNFVTGEAVNDLSYNGFQGYLNLGVEDYTLQVCSHLAVPQLQHSMLHLLV